MLLVRRKDTRERFAVKVMKKKYSSWEECMQLREIKSLKKMKHENIVKLKEVRRRGGRRGTWRQAEGARR